MKIVTYNINGLRPRVAQHGSLLRLLNSLDADIICFQETKVSRQDLSANLTMAEGYEAFVSCTHSSYKGRAGYSGVATFCRVTSAFSCREVALPLAAEEGFTGLIDSSRNRKIQDDFLLEESVKVEGLGVITRTELLKVDSEGRCLITDHGHFVLFNIYAPRAEADDNERVHFKLIFFKILQKRWEHLLAQGRRVFAVGDFNIAPASIDRCDAERGFEKNMFREWLRSMLRDFGGPFFDVFRSKHPGRKEAYTCFSQCIGAEEYNYGTRIDHVLISGPCLHEDHNIEGHNLLECHVEECDIMTQFKRGNSDNIQKWNGGRTIKLEGSDHIPVYVTLSYISDLPAHNTPSLSVRYTPEVRGWQQTIVSFLRKGPNSTCQNSPNLSSFKSTSPENCCTCVAPCQDCGAKFKHEKVVSSLQFSTSQDLPDGNYIRKNHNSREDGNSSVAFDEATTLSLENVKGFLSCSKATVNKKARHSTSSQLTIKSFFRQPKNHRCSSLETVRIDNSTPLVETGQLNDELLKGTESTGNGQTSSCSLSMALDEDTVNPQFSLKIEKDNCAILEWQRIQQKMRTSIPLCKGHGEPCVPRTVKKGSNIGHLFYVCARAQGPTSNTEANCGHFQWASLKSKEKPRVK